MRNKTVRNLSIFSIVVLMSGWVGHLLDSGLPAQQGEETPGMGLWLILPLLTTVVLRAFAGDGWKGIWLRPNFTGNFRWYFISFIIFPVITAVILAMGDMFGWIDFSNFRPDDYFAVFAASLLPNFIKNIFEEFVWRGYLTSKLVGLKVKDKWLYLIVGGVWGAWHVPYYLFFLPEAHITAILPVDRWVFALLSIAAMTAWTVMFVEIYLVTKSIWPAVILHMVEDSVINHLVIDQHIQIAAGREILVSPVISITSMLLYLSVGLLLRRWRKQREQQLSMQLTPQHAAIKQVNVDDPLKVESR